MRFLWKPVDGDEITYDFKPYELRTRDAEDIELVGGAVWETFAEWIEAINRGKKRAYRAAIWIMRRRDNPDLRFDELDLGVLEVIRVFDEDELRKAHEFWDAFEPDTPEDVALKERAVAGLGPVPVRTDDAGDDADPLERPSDSPSDSPSSNPESPSDESTTAG